MSSMTIGQVAVLLSILTSVAGWVRAVVGQFKAAGAALHEVPWRVRVNPLHMLVRTDAQTPASRWWWRRYILGVLLFLVGLGLATSLVTWGGVPTIRI